MDVVSGVRKMGFHFFAQALGPDKASRLKADVNWAVRHSISMYNSGYCIESLETPFLLKKKGVIIGGQLDRSYSLQIISIGFHLC